MSNFELGVYYYGKGNSISLKCQNEHIVLLIDTGASISILKSEWLDKLGNLELIKEEIKINGVCGNLVSLGYVYLDLTIKNKTISHKFYVFKELFCKTDGILGEDFLSNFNCIIDYETNLFKIQHHLGSLIQLPLKVNSNKTQITIPSRCEIVK